jgi:hypothetical protein
MTRTIVLLAVLGAMARSVAAQEQGVYDQVILGIAGCVLRAGSGSPEAAVTGSVCDTYTQSNTGDVWTKVSGTATSTGWAIVPRLSAANTWTAIQTLSAAEPILYFRETGAGTDLKLWRFDVASGVFCLQTVNDAGSSVLASPVCTTRAGITNFAGAGRIGVLGTSPTFDLFASGAGSNLKYWRVITNASGEWHLQTVDDAYTTGTDILTFTHAGAAVFVSSLTAAAITGTTGTFSSTLAATGLIIPSTGIRLPNAVFIVGRNNASVSRNLIGIDASNIVQIASSGDATTIGGALTVTGQPTLSTLTASQAVFTDASKGLVSNAITGTGNVAMSASPTFTGTITAASETFSGTAGSSGYVSQTTGWQATNAGAGDFRSLETEQLRARVFTSDLVAVTRGSARTTKSYGILTAAFTCPVAAGTATLVVKDAPEAPNVRLFSTNDWVALETYSRTDADTDGNLDLTIADCVGQVSSYVDGTGDQSWTFTRGGSGASAGSMSSSTVVAVNNVAIDYGPAGSGYTVENAYDGTEAANAPYFGVNTFVTAPLAANTTSRCRFGQLRGVTSVSEYGLICGNFSGNAYVRFSDQNAEITGIPFILKDGSTVTMKLDPAVPSFALGATLPSAYGTGAGVWMGKDGGVYKFRVGDPAGGQLAYDATTLKIGGWTIGADYIRDTAGVVGLSSAVTGGDDIRFWAGNATPSSAPFRCTEAGLCTMTSVSIAAGGVALDSSGLFISPVSASGGGAFANANAVRWTTDTTYRTAIWRSDDTSGTAFRKLWIEHIQQGTSGVNDTSTNLIAKTTMTAGSGSGTGQLKIRGQVNAVSETQLFAASNDGTNTRAATLYLGTLAGSPGQRAISLGFATNEAAMTSTSTAAPTLDQGIVIDLGGTRLTDTAVIVGSGTGGTTQSNLLRMDSNNSEAAGFSGGTSALVNVNFYADTGTNTQRRATIQSQRTGTSNRGGNLVFFTKPDSSAGADVVQAGYFDFDRGFVVGAPTGLSKGAGTINAQAVYDDNVLLTDWVYELYYDGQITTPKGSRDEAAPRPHPKRLYTIEELRTVTETEHRLPWMPSSSTFEDERGVGRLLTSIWQGTEQLSIYALEQAARLAAQEMRLAILEADVARLRAGGKQ